MTQRPNPLNARTCGRAIDVRGHLAAGRQTFLGIELLCGEGALVPRPETELLGRTASSKLQAAGDAAA